MIFIVIVLFSGLNLCQRYITYITWTLRHCLKTKIRFGHKTIAIDNNLYLFFISVISTLNPIDGLGQTNGPKSVWCGCVCEIEYVHNIIK